MKTQTKNETVVNKFRKYSFEKKSILTFTNENVSMKHATYLHKSQSKNQENISNMAELFEKNLTRKVQKKKQIHENQIHESTNK